MYSMYVYLSYGRMDYVVCSRSPPTNGSGGSPTKGTKGFLAGGKSSRGVKLITHLHLVLRLRKRGATPPLPKYVFMACCLIKEEIHVLMAWSIVEHREKIYLYLTTVV
jgi:hypothetical protein